ncbi:FUSC family protein [Streptomyces eurocidicus]|uniref:Putative membrane protein YccC n=1 Tax=Streptomyces eurocidicus TaxID=66423 RepID=A0A7W8BFI0_STREU|nr:FUSC family protein [Streptomyces eurocidicus]MBB5122355.1 putative membrane protein YccC [Streptomyces eurocidicus]
MTARVRRFLGRADTRRAARRALWVVFGGCPGFYVCRYVTGDDVMALYSFFGSLPLAMFCEVPGAARERTRTLLAAVPVGWVLVTAGTLLAVRSWAAACGMFVVGFVISYCGVGGPRVTGLATAFQLFYVLPCFPPYAPDTLGSRLAGLTLGILLTALAERLLWPDPDPVPYRIRLADAAAAVADRARAAADRLATGADGPDTTREPAERALEAVRLSRVPTGERPASPSVRDHALNHVRVLVRQAGDQLDRLFTDATAPHPAAPATVSLLRHTEDVLRAAAGGLRTGRREPPDDLPGALVAFDAARAGTVAGTPAARLRQDAVARAAAVAAMLTGKAARIALGDRPADDGAGFLAYATTPAPVRWWCRLRLHLTPHSVHLQNALRIAVALAAARLLVGVLGLSHGFWVLLATLSMMRTSAADTRAALRPAFAGTVAGAVVAAALLRVVGDVPLVYAVLLPVVLLVGFTVGPPSGPAATQAVFTLTVVLAFTQFTTPDWALSGVRLVDVLIGGAVGAVAGLFAWPQGGHGEVRRDTAAFLTDGAAACREVIALIGAGRGSRAPLEAARHAMLLAEASYIQYRIERAGRDPAAEPPWGFALAAGYDLVHGGELLVAGWHGKAAGPLPGAAAEELTVLAGRVADGTVRVAEALRSGADPVGEARPAEVPCPAAESSPLRQVAGLPPGVTDADALLVADAEAWLTGVARDLARLR